MIAEGWFRRPDKPSRISALDLLDYLPGETCRQLVTAALSDDCEAVRASSALRISDVFDRDAGLALVQRCLATEQCRRVIADLMSAQGELLLKL